MLAGEPFSDSPPSVHPVLASVARAVHDRVGEVLHVRDELACRLVGVGVEVNRPDGRHRRAAVGLVRGGRIRTPEAARYSAESDAFQAWRMD